MDAIRRTAEATVAFVVAFFGTESGLVRPQKSMPLAWTTGLLAMAAAVIGLPETALAACDGPVGCPGTWTASYCISGGACDYVFCGNHPAEWRHTGNSPDPADVRCCCFS